MRFGIYLSTSVDKQRTPISCFDRIRTIPACTSSKFTRRSRSIPFASAPPIERSACVTEKMSSGSGLAHMRPTIVCCLLYSAAGGPMSLI